VATLRTQKVVPTTAAAQARKVWLITALIVGFNALLVVWILLQPAGARGSAIVTDIAGVVGPLLVLPLCFGRPTSASVSSARRWAPVLLGLGILCYLLGRIVFTYFVWALDRLPPMPSVATIGFLAQYPFLLAAILLLLPRRTDPGVSRLRVVLDGLMIMTAVVTFSWYFFLGPVLYRASETALMKTFATTYPLADIVLIASILLLALRPGRSVRAALPVIALALVLIVVTDAIYGYGRINDTYVTGSLSDVGWVLGYMLLGLGAYLIRTGPPDRLDEALDGDARLGEGEPSRLWPSLLPYALVPAVGLLAIYAWRAPANGLAFGIYVGGAVLVLLLLLRQVLTIVENSRLYVRLRHQKDYSDALVHNSPAAIVTMDPDGTVLSWNPAAERLFGYPRNEAVGKAIDDLILPTAEMRDERAYFRQVIGEQGQVHVVTQRSHRDQTLVDVDMLSVPVTMAEGQATTYLAIYHDITELQRARQQAETANQAKSTFLANMSHELRTPLNAIIGYSEMLHEDAQDSGHEEFIPDLEKITSAGRQLLGLINAVLDLSKIEAGKMDLYLENFAVADLISDTAGVVEPLVRKNRNELKINCPDSIGTMRADLTKVRQSLLNLLSNASKFTKDGTITLDAARRVAAAQDQILISVTDTGIGLTPEQLGRLFQEFSQAEASTARNYGGTGLGLALSRHLCRMMGGDIAVISEPGRGSTFTITLPAAVADPALTQPPERPKSAITSQASAALAHRSSN
jgi:PAS domain S-box-containing protein